MRHLLTIPTAFALALTACAPVPDSRPDSGYDPGRRAQVDAQLEGRFDPATGRIVPPPDVAAAPLDGGRNGTGDEADIAQMAAAALRRDQAGGQATGASGVNVPQRQVTTSSAGVSGGAFPQSVTNSAGISAEDDFDAVSSERSIEDDAERLAQNRARYQVAQPRAVPTRDSASANVVRYALDTSHTVGTPMYSRGAFASKAREGRNCARFDSSDGAQEAFLEAGGPERDSEGLDADGDGFACGWSPVPYRRVRGN